MSRELNLNRIQIFKEVVGAGSFSKAATLLKQPKSRISRNIAALERDLGVRLIHRTTRQFQVTEAGKELFRSAAGPLEDLTNAVQQVSRHSDEISGNLRITAPEDLGVALLSNICRDFMVTYPKVKLDLHLSNEVVDILKESFDVAIRIGKLKDSTLTQRKLGMVRSGLFLSPEFKAKLPSMRTLDEVQELPFISFAAQSFSTTKLQVTNGKNQKSLKLTPVFSSNNYFVVKALALEGVGLAVLPLFLVQEELRNGTLIQIFKEWHPEENQVQFVMPTQKKPLPRVTRFVDFVAQRCSEFF